MAAILVKDIPDELRNLFKATCAKEGKTMRRHHPADAGSGRAERKTGG